jgi:hypothetical protein
MSEVPAQLTSALLDLEQAIDKFRQEVAPLIDPRAEENWDGVKLKSKEQAILQAGLRLVGHCLALLIYQLVLSQSVQRAAHHRASGQADLHYTSEGYKEVSITLMGGVEVRVPTLYKLARKARKGQGRKKKRGKRGKSQGQGFYPVLVLLGISERTTPLVRCYVTQAASQSPSFAQARPLVAWLGLEFSQSRIRRISEAFCQVGLAARAQQLTRLAAGQLPASELLKGKRVALAVDGGRLNIRQTHRHGRKRKSGWPGYETDWQEPKLLIIYVLDEAGRKVTRTDLPLVADGTLLGLDKFMKILEMYLHQLGVAQAESIVLLGDGATWIWNNVPALLQQLGCRPEQIIQILDNCHATQHLYKLGEALFGLTSGQVWTKKWAKRLKKGKAKAVVNEIKHLLDHHKSKDLETAQTEYNFFLKHLEKGRLDYAYFKEQNWPLGSGVVESLIRQVINIRLKSCSKAWLEENAEAFLHARCQWAVHKWSDFCDTVLTFRLAPLSPAKL